MKATVQQDCHPIRQFCQALKSGRSILLFYFLFGCAAYSLFMTGLLGNSYDDLWHKDYYISGTWDLSIGRWMNKLINENFRQYVGNILASTTNPDTGEKPTFGQLTQGNISPHVEMLRLLSTQFSAATGLPVTDSGVVNDANPTSSDAILAQTQTLVSMAEELNAGNGDSLRTIALMAQAIMDDISMEDLSEEQKAIVAHFKNPAMPSVAVTADAAIKIASARQGFASTDTFLEMIGFDKADIRRIKAQEQLARGRQTLQELNI